MNKSRVLSYLQFIVFLLLGALVFVVFSHMRPVFAGTIDIVGRMLLVALLLAGSLLSKRQPKYATYSNTLYAFFVVSVAMAVDLYLPSGKWIASLFVVPIDSPAGIAIDKLDSTIILVSVILVLWKLRRRKYSDLYLAGGNLKISLLIGGFLFLVFAALSYYIAILFGAKPYTFTMFMEWLPYILIFIFGNAFNEELMFRGLFIKDYSTFMGAFFANLVTAIPFVLHHTGVSYTKDTLMFLVILVPLALAWGHLIRKTNSLWGSVLFHAATDIPVVISIFSAMQGS